MDESIGKQLHQSKILSQITSVAVCVLLALFFVVNMSNMTTIKKQIESLKDGPYPVSVAAGRIETLLVQSQTITHNVALIDAPKAAEQMEAQYKKVNSELAEKLVFVIKSEIMGDDFVQTMQKGYNQLRENEKALISMCKDPNISRIELNEYAQTQIIPIITSMVDENEKLINTSTEMVNDVYSSINQALGVNIIFSWILIIAVVVSIFVFLTILNRKDMREEQLRANLNEAAELANSANRAKSAFLSSMSHDIRTPLNAIVGFTTLARSSEDDPIKQRSYINQIEVASAHLLSLINDVIDMSEIESGKITLAQTPFYADEFIAEITTIIQPLAIEKHQNLQIVHDENDKELLVGDTTRLKQIVLNLATNAVKYTAEKGDVTITFEKSPSPQPDLIDFIITVTDNGIGMNADFLESIFDPFVREFNDKTAKIEGVGLGMYITKTIVDAMGGTIDVKSELDVGSTFTVVLPLRVASKEEIALHSQIAPEAEREWIKAAAIDSQPDEIHGRILLVEDDPLNQEIAVELIRETGVEVETANDGVEAYERMKTIEPGYYDLIFMDFRMPRMSGLEASRAIVQFENENNIAHTPIIALTANAFNEDRQQASDAGLDGFITKPINLDELRRTLRSYLS